MRTNIQLQLAVVQCWLLSHIICKSIYDRNVKENTNLIRNVRGLRSSFMPGFGKRQSSLMQNVDKQDEMPIPPYTNIGNDLTGNGINEGPYPLYDATSDDMLGRMRPGYINDDADDDVVLDKAMLKALVQAYIGNTANEVNEMARINDMARNWMGSSEQGRRDMEKRLRLIQDFGNMKGRQGWGNSMNTGNQRK